MITAILLHTYTNNSFYITPPPKALCRGAMCVLAELLPARFLYLVSNHPLHIDRFVNLLPEGSERVSLALSMWWIGKALLSWQLSYF